MLSLLEFVCLQHVFGIKEKNDEIARKSKTRNKIMKRVESIMNPLSQRELDSFMQDLLEYRGQKQGKLKMNLQNC